MIQLQVGDLAPEFVGKDQQGQLVRLSDFAGKNLIFYFYLQDSVPVCTTQACGLRNNYEMLKEMGYEVLGISTDNAEKHKHFIEKNNLPYSLICDEDRYIHEQYGTWVEKILFGRKYWGTARTTFVIDPEGRIAKIIDKVRLINHVPQIFGKAF